MRMGKIQYVFNISFPIKQFVVRIHRITRVKYLQETSLPVPKLREYSKLNTN